jgi:MoaA/NifB/PqqE/SkfB family radical SAM enzyme
MGGPRFLIGGAKALFYARLVGHGFARYLGRLLTGKLGVVAFAKLLLRLVLFLHAVRHNKVVEIAGRFKIQLYLPAYPTPAFWESIEKFVRPDPGPLTVVFSMTKACGYKCPHCYQRHDTGPDLPMPLLQETARQMQAAGVTMFDIEGGEPLLLFDRLLELMRAFDDKREIWINTTGHTLTPERVRQLKEAGLAGVMISLHAEDADAYDRFTGFPGSFELARSAARQFSAAGIMVAINCCPTPEMVADGAVERILRISREWGAAFVQVIHQKSAGAWLGKDDRMINATASVRELKRLHLEYNTSARYHDFPMPAVQVFEEDETHFGCTAGGIDRFYLNANGEVQPCEFLNVSFGNVQQESFATIFRRMREAFPEPGTRWLCSTEARSIHETMRAHRLEATPLPWEYTRDLVKTWKRGRKTPLYRKMGLYK